MPERDRGRLTQFGKERAREGAGPMTIGIDLGYIRTILSHAAAVHGAVLSIEPIVRARIALARLGCSERPEKSPRLCVRAFFTIVGVEGVGNHVIWLRGVRSPKSTSPKLSST